MVSNLFPKYSDQIKARAAQTEKCVRSNSGDTSSQMFTFEHMK